VSTLHGREGGGSVGVLRTLLSWQVRGSGPPLSPETSTRPMPPSRNAEKWSFIFCCAAAGPRRRRVRSPQVRLPDLAHVGGARAVAPGERAAFLVKCAAPGPARARPGHCVPREPTACPAAPLAALLLAPTGRGATQRNAYPHTCAVCVLISPCPSITHLSTFFVYAQQGRARNDVASTLLPASPPAPSKL